MACAVCASPLGPRYVAFVRRIRRLVYQSSHDKSKATEQVLGSDLQPAWCSIGCWEDMADSMVSALQLKTPFPGTGPVVPCSRCGDPVDKAKAHVAYVVLDIEVKDAPWLSSGHVYWQRVLAVLCLNCESPDANVQESMQVDEEPEEQTMVAAAVVKRSATV